MDYIKTVNGIFELESKNKTDDFDFDVYKTKNHHYYYGDEVLAESKEIKNLVDFYVLKSDNELKIWSKTYNELIEYAETNPSLYKIFGCICVNNEGIDFVSKIVNENGLVREELK